MFSMEKLNNYTLKDMGQILGLKKSQVANIRAGKRELSALEVLLIKQSEDDLGLRFFNWLPDEKLFWHNVETLQSHLVIEDNEMAKMFSLEQRPFRFLRSNSKTLPWTSTEYFHLRYKIHPALWFSYELDCECLAKNIKSTFRSNAYLPTIFEGGGSKMRVLANLINFVHQKWGDDAAESLKASLQITQESLNFEKDISIRIFSSLHQRLRFFGAQDHHFEEMGAFNRLNRKNKAQLSQKVPPHLSQTHEVMKYFFQKLVGKLDLNRSFVVLKSDSKAISILAKPTEIFKKSYLPEQPFAQYEIALYIKGHIKVIPTYFGFNELSEVSMDFNPATGEAVYTGIIDSIKS